MCEILLSNADWDCFRTLTLREILKIQNPLLEEHCAFSEVIHLFQQVGCARNKHQFLTAQQNLRLSLWTRDWDWMVCPLWNYVILFLFLEICLVFQIERGNLWMVKTNLWKIDAMKDIDSVPSNVQSASREALLYVFEDNEAVIKMIMKGTSPTMRHVSRTHRVALDWLFDRINFDTKIQIHRHQKPTRRHLDKGQFHTWWMESFVDSV